MSSEDLLASRFAALPDIIRGHAAERPGHPALVEGDETLTWGGLAALMDRVAAALRRDGVRPGDAVAICAQTSINYAAAFCGVLAAGARSRRSRRHRAGEPHDDAQGLRRELFCSTARPPRS